MRTLFMGTPDFALFPQALLSGREYGRRHNPARPANRQKVQAHPPPVRSGPPGANSCIPAKNCGTTNLRNCSPGLTPSDGRRRLRQNPARAFSDIGGASMSMPRSCQYRGAAPIQRAIIDGKSVTGVTIMQMDDGHRGYSAHPQGADTQRDNFQTLHDKLVKSGAEALLKTLRLLREGKSPAQSRTTQRPHATN